MAYRQLSSGALVFPLRSGTPATDFTLAETLADGQIVPAFIAVDGDDPVGFFAGTHENCARKLEEFFASMADDPDELPYEVVPVEVLDEVSMRRYFAGENIFTRDAPR